VEAAAASCTDPAADLCTAVVEENNSTTGNNTGNSTGNSTTSSGGRR
jgi:hypothetical protein